MRIIHQVKIEITAVEAAALTLGATSSPSMLAEIFSSAGVPASVVADEVVIESGAYMALPPMAMCLLFVAQWEQTRGKPDLSVVNCGPGALE